jgi:hypothetical protein
MIACPSKQRVTTSTVLSSSKCNKANPKNTTAHTVPAILSSTTTSSSSFIHISISSRTTYLAIILYCTVLYKPNQTKPFLSRTYCYSSCLTHSRHSLNKHTNTQTLGHCHRRRRPSLSPVQSSPV